MKRRTTYNNDVIAQEIFTTSTNFIALAVLNKQGNSTVLYIDSISSIAFSRNIMIEVTNAVYRKKRDKLVGLTYGPSEFR